MTTKRILAGVTLVAVIVGAIWVGTRPQRMPAGRSSSLLDGLGTVGLTGLPQEGASPSSPAHGELLLSFTFGHTMGDPRRFTLDLYEDGRIVWERWGAHRFDPVEPTGLIEQRLTPEGVDLVMDEVLSTGLFGHDRDLTLGHGLLWGEIRVRDGDRMVRVTWGDIVPDDAATTSPTSEQAATLLRLDDRLEDPRKSWLPSDAWKDRELRPFVPSTFKICYGTDFDLSFEEVLAEFPRSARPLLASLDRTVYPIESGGGVWCSRASTSDARGLAGILDEAESRRIDGEPFLGYGFGRELTGDREPSPAEVSMFFYPVLPQDV